MVNAARCLITEGRIAFDRLFPVAEGSTGSRTSETCGKTINAYAEWLASQKHEIKSALRRRRVLNGF